MVLSHRLVQIREDHPVTGSSRDEGENLRGGLGAESKRQSRLTWPPLVATESDRQREAESDEGQIKPNQ